MVGNNSRDPRQEVGGVVYAKADAISRDYKRILGNLFKTSWIKGEVLRVDKKKSNPTAKRTTTYVTARYPCEVHDGVQQYKEKELCLQILKDKDPNPPPELPAPAAAPTPTREGGPEEEELTPTAVTAEAPAAPTTEGTNATVASESSGSSTVPVVTVNGRHWYEGNCNVDINGKHSARYWKLQDQYGRGFEFTPGCDSNQTFKFTNLDYFMALFPKQQLQDMEERTNDVLGPLTLPSTEPTTVGEILKFFGILLLITRFEFGSRASLWATTGFTRLVPAPNFGRTTGMSRQRFRYVASALSLERTACDPSCYDVSRRVEMEASTRLH